MRTQHSHLSVRQASSDVIAALHLLPKAPLPLMSLFQPFTALALVPPSSSTALSHPPVARAPASSSAPSPPFQSGNTSRRPTLSSRSPPTITDTHTPWNFSFCCVQCYPCDTRQRQQHPHTYNQQNPQKKHIDSLLVFLHYGSAHSARNRHTIFFEAGIVDMWQAHYTREKMAVRLRHTWMDG
jgi:hypothetical protein